MNDQENKSFVTKVYCLMKLNGITQSDMAKKLGVKRAYIYQVLHGMRPGNAIRDKIAKEVGFSTWEDLKKHEEVLK